MYNEKLEITSLQNPKIKQALKLWKKSERDETGLFLIEGFRELSRSLHGSCAIVTLFTCPDFFLGENEQHLIKSIKATGALVLECSKAVFQKLSYRDRPDGLLAVAKQFYTGLSDLKIGNDPFFVIAEGIEKPGNLGTILRSADAAGADAVIVCDKKTDIFNPNVVRASVGTLFTQPVVEASTQETLAWLNQHRIKILAATPHAEHIYSEISMKGALAIVMGCEQYGLQKEWLEQADLKVKIPMHGVADSLNVAMATTILLYEAERQRREQS